jgi:hypothetical protein
MMKSWTLGRGFYFRCHVLLEVFDGFSQSQRTGSGVSLEYLALWDVTTRKQGVLGVWDKIGGPNWKPTPSGSVKFSGWNGASYCE